MINADDNKEIEALMNSCRLCMSNNMEMRKIFDVSYDIGEKILFCTGVEVRIGDHLPPKICITCINDLQIAHKLRTTSIVADETFRMLIKVNKTVVKIEVDLNENGNYGDENNRYYNYHDHIDAKGGIKKETEQAEMVLTSLRENNVIVKKVQPQSVISADIYSGDDPGPSFLEPLDTESRPQIKLESVSQKKNYSSADNKIVDVAPSEGAPLVYSPFCKKINIQTTSSKPKLVKPATRIFIGGDNKNSHIDEKPKRNSNPNVKLKTPAQRIFLGGDKWNDDLNVCVSPSSRKMALPLDTKGKRKRVERCNLCNIYFTTRGEKVRHMRDVHNIEKVKIERVCEVCGKICIDVSAYNKHMVSHKPPQYRCDDCEYKTGSKADLVKHMYTHTGVKPFMCAECPRRFRTRSNLAAHVRRAHRRLRAHACPVCARAFVDPGTLRTHYETHNQIRRHECEICHSKFPSRHSWRRHMIFVHGVSVPQQKSGRKKTNYIAPEQD